MGRGWAAHASQEWGGKLVENVQAGLGRVKASHEKRCGFAREGVEVVLGRGIYHVRWDMMGFPRWEWQVLRKAQNEAWGGVGQPTGCPCFLRMGGKVGKKFAMV